MKKNSIKFYFETHKFIRDIVHEYVNITDFELQIIDTPAFQRLKDIRQLTCQHVYPAARHSRFEHSLGVLELTRQAIKHINKNGLIDDKKFKEVVIDKNLEFNACIAALLHDIGHCPFSHLGEIEFDKNEIRQELIDIIKSNSLLKRTKLLKEIKKKEAKEIGAVHEQLSCIIIINTYSAILSNLDVLSVDEYDACEIKTDFELIIRAILGLEYDVSSKEKFDSDGKKNIIVRLINSKIFDMDKLDYIMRDSKMTGIGTPQIDTKRLFRNMYLDNSYSLIFASRAVPVLQNMIDSRDGLYLYVYNHHAVVYSDFMNTYILRRLSHNARDFLNIAFPNIEKENMEELEDNLLISSLGLVPKPYLFSFGAITNGLRSDSDWISLLNIINTHYNDEKNYIVKNLVSELEAERTQNPQIETCSKYDINKIEKLTVKIINSYKLIANYKTRKFLKPWWKTVFEFTNFMTRNFQDDVIRDKLGKWICNGGDHGLEASEICSQIAKHVIFLTSYLYDNIENHYGLAEKLNEGDFFIIERSNRFFEIDAIEKLQIALKVSEIIGLPKDTKYNTKKYYIKNLTNIIPQKDYSSIYAKEGFYVFSKPVLGNIESNMKQKHNQTLEKIFVFVATEFIQRGENDFLQLFNCFHNLEEKEKLQKASLNNMLIKFIEQNGIN